MGVVVALCTTFSSVVYAQTGTENALIGSALAAGAEATGITIEADETGFDNGVATAKGNVHIAYGNTEIFAGKAEYHQSTGDVFTEGGVKIYKDGIAYSGEAAIYNIHDEKITANYLRSGSAPLFYETKSMETEMREMDEISMTESIFTTHDSANPNYRIKSKKMKIVHPDDPQRGRVIFRDATVYAGNVPILWLPYLSQPLNPELGYHFLPGFRSNWGAFLLNRYGFMIGDHTLATARLDLRSERGLAGGFDLKSMRHAENPNFGNFKFYYANDQDTQQTHNGGIREDDIDQNRYRINLQHRIYLPGPDESTLYIDIDFNKISDAFFYEDFFQEEFRIDPQPDNLINLTKVFPQGTVSLLGRYDVNDFYRTDTRLPEIALDINTTPIFKTGLFYTGSTSWGIYDEELGTRERDEFTQDLEKAEMSLLDPTAALLDDPEFDPAETESLIADLQRELAAEIGFTRFDTYHEISFPKTYFGWLSLNPKVGFRATDYSDVDAKDASSTTRTALYAGFDASFKLSKEYANVSLPKLGVDGLRHIAQPHLSYSYVAADDTLDPRAGKIDRYAPTTRLRPIDMNQVTAIDEIDDWHVIRPGLFNRFQTKRDGRAYTLISNHTYFDYYATDLEYDRDFSTLYNDFKFLPVPWLMLNVESQIPAFGGSEFNEYTEVNTGLTVMPTDKLEFVVRNRFLEDHPFFEDSNLIEFQTYYKLGDRLGLSGFWRFEADDSTLEWQQYTAHFDLSSWTIGLGAFVRDHRETDEFGVAVSFTLKDFPQLSVPFELNPAAN